MMNQHVFYSLILLLAVAVIAPLAVLTWRRGWLRPLLTDKELVVFGKLMFVILAVMIMVVFRNTVEIPSGQFIYGRF